MIPSYSFQVKPFLLTGLFPWPWKLVKPKKCAGASDRSVVVHLLHADRCLPQLQCHNASGSLPPRKCTHSRHRCRSSTLVAPAPARLPVTRQQQRQPLSVSAAPAAPWRCQSLRYSLPGHYSIATQKLTNESTQTYGATFGGPIIKINCSSSHL